MTATLDEQGRLLLPEPLRAKYHASAVTRFEVTESVSGVLTVRPAEQRPKRKLTEAFASLRGLEIPRLREPAPDPIEL